MSLNLENFPYTEFTYATLPKTQRGQPIVLGGDPKGVNFLYTNGNSVIIRNIEVSLKFVHGCGKTATISSV